MRWIIAPAFALTLGTAHAACPGYTACPGADFPGILATNPQARATLAAIDATEAATLQSLQTGSLSFQQLVALLGQAIAFDRTLSFNATEACALCHSPANGFTRGIGAFARTGGIMPGAVHWRAGLRVPQTLAYAAFAPVLAWRPATQDFAGGNLWDSRATGAITGSPAADQSSVPLTSPFEMALPDPACAVRRVAQSPYAGLFANVWGQPSLAIAWPANTDARCARPADGRHAIVLDLPPAERARASLTVQQIGLTIATYEQSILASPFASLFDRVQAGQARFTADQRAGYALFTGRAQCAACHTITGPRALFTDFSSANLGVPRNAKDPYLTENAPGAQGYVANPAGPAFIDQGLGGFLASSADTDPAWQAQAPRFFGAFQTPTLRNVAAAPAHFPRTYMHNGVFRNLAEIVHFLNTRDTLPVCAGSAGIGQTCWPAPEQPQNIDHARTGNLGLTHAEESSLVAFLQTLTDTASP